MGKDTNMGSNVIYAFFAVVYVGSPEMFDFS